MSENTTTVVNTTFDADVEAARLAYSVLNRKKGLRPAAVIAFLTATDADAMEDAIAEHGAGLVRRGLREAAVFFESHDMQETADVFWALRDDIDLDGEVFRPEADAA